MIKIFGCRCVGVISGVIGAGSYACCCWFCRSLASIVVMDGFFVGVGLGMSFLASNVVIGYYFEKWRALATGLSACGSGLGTLIIPPVLEYLRKGYGWRHSFILLILFMVVATVVAFLYLPLQPVNIGCMPSSSRTCPVKSKPKKGFCVCCPFGFTRSHISVNTKFSPEDKKCPCDQNVTDCLTQEGGCQCEQKSNEIQEDDQNTQRQQIRMSSLKTIISSCIDCKLLGSPCFHIFLWCGFFLIAGYMIPMFYIIDRAKSIGINKTLSVWLLSLIGLTVTIGRIIGGLLQTLTGLNVIVYSYTMFIIAGISTIISSFNSCLHLPAQIVYAIVFGTCCSSFFLRPVIATELFGIENLASAFGLQMFFMGFGTCSGLYCAGLILDRTNSHQYVFVLAGVLMVFSGVLMMMLRSSRQWELRRGILV